MKKEIIDLAASVRQRLLNLRDPRREEYQAILNRFGLERFLYRISRSPFADRLILKGASSFEIWGPDLYRTTRDADFLGLLDPSAEEIRRTFSSICRQEVAADGLIFDPESVSVDVIQERNLVRCFRVRLTARLQNIRIRLQFDICTGEPITPKLAKAEFPTILPFPAPRIMVYPKELTIAEKYRAMCAQGMLNSRVKDYYDIYQFSRRFGFKGAALNRGIRMIFDGENSPVPLSIPDALSDAFARLPEKQKLWRRFLERIGKGSLDLTFDRAVVSVREFVLPPAMAAAEKKRFELDWPPGGPWQKRG